MDDLNILMNCSMEDFYYNDSDLCNVTFGSRSSEVNLLEVGTLTGISVALILDLLISLDVKANVFTFISKEGITLLKNKLQLYNTKVFARILLLALLVLTLPIVTLFLVLAFSYKVLCSVIIKRKDKRFVSFLDSFDVFWSLEDDASKSIINVLGIVESDSPNTIANDIKKKLLKIFPNPVTKKIFYRRNEGFGFYYWRRYKSVDIDQYVEVVELPKRENNNDSKMDLEDLMTDLQKHSLPYGDEGLFKILITRQRVGNCDKERGDYGIIFRIHHSVGDGVALIEFLCQTLADQREDHPAHMFSFPEQTGRHSANKILEMMHQLFEIPVCFVDGILRKPDSSTLHGPALLGKKVFKWTESDENLLVLVKEIKDNVDQLNFSDILLSALSSGLHDFFSEKMAADPEDVAVVLPVRFQKTSITNGELLKNDFSVTILDLPVKGNNNMRIDRIKKRCNKLRESADPLTNYFFLKLVSGILPKSILQPLLNSSQASMVFSNMPGPGQLSICGGNALKELVFFVPHKGTTGLGVTALCYGGVLRLAAMADTALVPTSEDLNIILEGMVKEIKRLHKLHVIN